MAKSEGPVTIKKYANRRLYNTGTSTYVTLEDLATMVKSGEDFAVFDAKTGDDITRSVLTQIIFEQENKEGAQNLLPIKFLRQLIGFYGGAMQKFVPSYLEVSLEILHARAGEIPPADFPGLRRDAVRADHGRAGAAEHGDVQAGVLDVHAVRAARGRGGGRSRKPAAAATSGSDLEELRKQLDDMRRRSTSSATARSRRLDFSAAAASAAPFPTASPATHARSACPADSRSPTPPALRRRLRPAPIRRPS